MNQLTSNNENNVEHDEQEVFEDSAFLANFVNTSFKDSNSTFPSILNDSNENQSALNISALCCDEELNGYDKLTGQTWIYPTNYPIRDYQFNIIRSAMLKNTLVSLPTGLGKTFIAAVIMYNFYRWYPIGKIIFIAPTRPLVAQQIEACYNIIAIPPSDTVEMTGQMQIKTRKEHWLSKRVIFATPQVIFNDIKSGICPGDKIRCLVVDEAHRARGNYAYCQIVSTLTALGHKTYRILALSATPGSKVENVVTVIKNLHISHLELRTENCIDVAKYSFARKINTVVIPLGPELTQLRTQYVEILDVYARRLKQLNILPQNLGNVSKGRVVMMYKEFQTKDRGARHPQHNYIMKDFTLLIALYHGLELLTKHGSRVFLNFFDEHPEKSWMQSDDRLTALLERLRDDLGVNPMSLDRSLLPDGTISEMPKNISYGHPKFYKLKEIMLQHFTEAKRKEFNTKAIVFCEYRESVNLVHCLLLQCRPLITAHMFVGQGASGKDGKQVTQKQRARVMRAFASGACNALVATCVAEEGLDVGAVDLCICFDVSSRSPVRLVQRCGRTGRERSGQVYILVTEGREHQTLLDCMQQRDGLNKKIQQSKAIEGSLYQNNPRLVPHGFVPQCRKMFITVAKKNDKEIKAKKPKKSKKGNTELRPISAQKASPTKPTSSVKEDTNSLITPNEFTELFPQGLNKVDNFSKPIELWTFNKASSTQDLSAQNIALSSPITSKKQDAPPIELPKKSKVTSSALKIGGSPVKKNGDIRALFSTVTKSTKNYTKLITDLGIKTDGGVSLKLIDLFVDLNANVIDRDSKCLVCDNFGDCSVIQNLRKGLLEPTRSISLFLNDLKLPEISLINDFDKTSILRCSNKPQTSFISDKITEVDIDLDNRLHNTNNFDLDFDFHPSNDSPKNHATNVAHTNFNIGDVDDIFFDSSTEEGFDKTNTEENKEVLKNDCNSAFGFFRLDKLDDIFADDDSMKENIEQSTNVITGINQNNVSPIKNTNLEEKDASPSVLSGRPGINFVHSPILCTQLKKVKLSAIKNNIQSSTPLSNSRKELFPKTVNNNLTAVSTLDVEEKSSTNISKTSSIIPNNSLFTITQLVDLINKTEENKSDFMNSSTSDGIEATDKHNTRSSSPILLTQADKKRYSINESLTNRATDTPQHAESLIILESDTDSGSDTTEIYDLHNNNFKERDKKLTVSTNPEQCVVSPDASRIQICNKRKVMEDDDDNVLSTSPFFNKKLKLSQSSEKLLTLQEKVLKVLTSNKLKHNDERETGHKSPKMNLMLSPINFSSQKENTCLQGVDSYFEKKDSKIPQPNLNYLHMFKKGSNVTSPKKKLETILNSPFKVKKLNTTFVESDEDFEIINENKAQKQHEVIRNNRKKQKLKKKKANEFLDLEAKISDDEASGDELTDESVGSIIDFINDDNEEQDEDNIHAQYLKSVRSPVNGVFKIPNFKNQQLDKMNVLSQSVEEDSYEMDSFCVDSHIGLTQANDVSELEIAEMVLDKKYRDKRKRSDKTINKTDYSPVIIRRKAVKRLIQSDSDDSS